MTIGTAIVASIATLCGTFAFALIVGAIVSIKKK